MAPQTKIGSFISYCNNYSSLFLVILTFSYVLTTNRQLISMEKQLNVMDSSVKLQIQPLPVPKIENIYLQKINAYVGPESGFSKIEMIARLHFDLNLKNVGTGAALNINVFPSIEIIDETTKEIVLPDFRPEQIHLLSENETETGRFMLCDKDFELFRGMNPKVKVMGRQTVTLKLDIYYKNIFGSGFVERASYSLSPSSGHEETVEQWKDFIDNKYDEIAKDIKRYDSLKKSLPDEADQIFKSIREKLESKFKEDLPLKTYNNSNSYSIDIVNFEEEIKKANEHNDKKIKEYFPQTHAILKKTTS